METYVGENPPKSKGVVWVHHDTYNDINYRDWETDRKSVV